ncbi:hypothetical protein F5Y16DRAFT_394739 [Xylariaceae sp. FL0255]|nr:hypothetical protein F5Y16DRAFT_394739 [Xylariaceae sp. FL0255]
MPRRPVYLRNLLYTGFNSGLHFFTKSYDAVDENGNQVSKHRDLLAFPTSINIARTIWEGLGGRDDGGRSMKPRVNFALADLYTYAAANVHLCEMYSPQDFFAEAKESRYWSSFFTNDEFWELTYRLLHARARHKARYYQHHEPAGYPLMVALDLFKEKFDELYHPDNMPLETHPVRIEQAQEEYSIRLEVHKAYFRYSLADSQGDGSDKIIVKPMETREQNMDFMTTHEPAPASEEAGEPRLWFYDLGPRNPRYGHMNVSQQIEAQMDAADKEEENKADDGMDVDDDDDIPMDISDEEMDDVEMDLGAFSLNG